MKNNTNASADEKSELVNKICAGTCSAADLLLIESLKRQDAEFALHVANLEKAFKLVDDIDFIESIDTESEYQVVHEKIKETKRRNWVGNIQKFAAVLALPLLMTTFLLTYWQFFGKKEEVHMVEVFVPHGAILSYELPDKSVVCLNSGSRLTYPTHFTDKKREISLDGEGYFTVTADRENPFYVHTTYGVSTYVYGTQFNVNAYKNDGYVETTLVEGKLDLLDSASNLQAKVLPGESVRYSGLTRTMETKLVDVEDKLGWQSGQLVFRNTPFLELIKRLERRFNAQINVIGQVDEKSAIRATFKVESLEQILDYLSLTVNMTWEAVDNPNTINKEINIKLY